MFILFIVLTHLEIKFPEGENIYFTLFFSVVSNTPCKAQKKCPDNMNQKVVRSYFNI